MFYLKPSDIRFSQDSINNSFGKYSSHRNKRIGETLDDLCEDRYTINSIPIITVVKKGEHWVTADNRRLWVFQELERHGKCDTIPVTTGSYIPPAKLTSWNGGVSVRVRRDPGGQWHKKPSVHKLTDTNSSLSENVEFCDRIHAPANSEITSRTNHFGSQSTSPSNSEPKSASVYLSIFYREKTELSESFESVRAQSASGSIDKYSRYQNSPDKVRVEDPMKITTTTSPSIQNTQNNGRAPPAFGNSQTFGIAHRYSTPVALMSFASQFSSDFIRKGKLVSKYSYGIKVKMPYRPGVDPIEKRALKNGKELCRGRFSLHIEIGQEIKPMERYGKRYYTLHDGSYSVVAFIVYKSVQTNPKYVDDPGCFLFGRLKKRVGIYKEKEQFAVEMLCDESLLYLILEVTQNDGEQVHRKRIGYIDYM